MNSEYNQEKGIIIRFYLTILQYYINDNGINEKLEKAWIKEMKPFLYQKYPITKSNEFTQNADLHLLIEIVDTLLKEKPKKTKNEEKHQETKKVDSSNKNIKNITPGETNKNITKDSENKEQVKDNETKNIKNKINSKESIKQKEVEDIHILRKQNIPKIRGFLEEFIKNYQITVEKKRTNSMKNLRPHSQTIASATTCDDSNLEDSNLNINQLIESKDDKKTKESFSRKSINIYEDIYNINEEEEKKTENNDKKNLIRSRTMISINEMLPKYSELDEIDKYNIIYKEPNKVISFILPDLMLKKIIFDGFMKKDSNALLVYHFCQQCFCFINKEIFFKKIFDCFKYYKSKKIPLEQLGNLIDFVNVLIIEMFEYYPKIDFKEMQIDYNIIKKFYNDLINDLLKEDDDDNKAKKEINNENKNIVNRLNLINDDLNTDINSINIFILKNKSNEAKESKEIKENKNAIKPILVNKNNKKATASLRSVRNSISYKENITFTFTQKIEDKKDKDKDEKIKKSQSGEIKEEPKKLFQITRTIKKWDDVIIEECDKEENSDDENKKMNQKNKDILNFGSDSDEENNTNSNKNKINTKENDDRNDVINSIFDKSFNTKKIVTTKEEILYKLNWIIPLIYYKNEEDLPSNKIKQIKSHMQFYKDINYLTYKKSKKNIFARINSKKLTKNPSSLNLTRLPTAMREYLKKGYFCILDWNTEEIGDKLMNVSINLLDKINRKELYRGIFLKKDKNNTSPNVVECIDYFNKLTSFIIEDVISYNSTRDRAKIYEKWVQIADYCRLKKDYNDCIAIYSALNNYIITGLKLTMKEVRTKIKYLFEQISNFCACEGNYKNIREDINICDSKGEIFIPYLGMLLRDINFFEESFKYISDTGCFNMEKIENIDAIMSKYFRYKDAKKKLLENYKPIPELKFFDNLEQISEEKLEEKANQIEPELKQKTSKIKNLTNIDKKYFKEYFDNYNQKNFNKRSTVCLTSEQLRNAITFTGAQSQIITKDLFKK